VKYAVISKDYEVRALYSSRSKATNNANANNGDMIALCPACRTKNSMQNHVNLWREKGRKIIGLIKPEHW
jgi:hypothetical protein